MCLTVIFQAACKNIHVVAHCNRKHFLLVHWLSTNSTLLKMFNTMTHSKGLFRRMYAVHRVTYSWSIRAQSYSAQLFNLERSDLTQRAREYHTNGYLIVPQLFSSDEIQNIKSEMIEIARCNRGEIDGATRDEISSDHDILNKYIAIHFPHKISQKVLHLATKHEPTTQILSEIISPNVKLVQTMMFIKGSGQQGQNWHQDEYYIPTRDKSLTGVWVAIDDVTIDNGCLWIIPQSHLPGFIYPAKDHQDYENFDRTPRAVIEYFGEYQYEQCKQAIPVEVKSGDVAFFNGYTLHRSLKNVSNGFRLSFANHYMSADSMLPWNYDDRLEGYVRDARDIVMVCGDDPYEYKGIEDLETTKPFVREKADHNQMF
eukprot:401453_1